MPSLQLLYFGGTSAGKKLQDAQYQFLLVLHVFTIYQQISFSTAFKNLIQHKTTPLTGKFC